MRHLSAHQDASTNGTPWLNVVMFLAMIPLTLLLPIAEITIEGAQSPRLLINIINTESGLNPFALILLLAPIVGIVESLIAHKTRREASALIAFLAIVFLFLTFSILNSQINRMEQGNGSVSIDMGGYSLIAGYTAIFLINCIAVFRMRNKPKRVMP